MATDIIARGMITEYKSGTNIDFTENEDGSVTISASGDVSSEDTVARDTIDNHKLDKNNPHNVTAEQIGLGNVNNTADLDKPVSNATQAELDEKAEKVHAHSVEEITDFPDSLPANGGNADTVNNHTVDCDVPANAVFTDTTNSDVAAAGNPVQLDGLQGGVPFSEITVSGKNLVPSDYMAKSGTYNGVTVIVKDNGRFDVSGTPTKSFALLTFTPSKYFLEGGKQYTFSCNHKYDINTFNIFARVYNKNGVQIQGISTYPTTITANDGDYFSWVLWVTENYEISATDVEVQLEYGSTATEYEPPITGRELTVSACGKNLVQYPYIGQRVQAEGITMVDNGDGSVTVNGRCDTIDATFYMQPITLLPDTGYVLSGCPVGGSTAGYRIQFADNDWKKIYADFGNGTKIRVDKKMTFHQFRIIIAKGTVCDNLVFRPQLELGDTATEFELYHGAEYTITPDSNPYVIPNDIRQQEGYNVISVSAGELSVSGVRKNAALKRVWKEIDDIKTAMIVSNGETE